jgi:predicted nucleic acid-binding protein
MIGATETMQSPEEIQLQIALRRASLDAKINELERRLSPREQMARVRSQLNPEPYLGWIAATAVATGAALAYRGLRRPRRSNGVAVLDDPAAVEMMGE